MEGEPGDCSTDHPSFRAVRGYFNFSRPSILKRIFSERILLNKRVEQELSMREKKKKKKINGFVLILDSAIEEFFEILIFSFFPWNNFLIGCWRRDARYGSVGI